MDVEYDSSRSSHPKKRGISPFFIAQILRFGEPRFGLRKIGLLWLPGTPGNCWFEYNVVRADQTVFVLRVSAWLGLRCDGGGTKNKAFKNSKIKIFKQFVGFWHASCNYLLVDKQL